ncbi:MAG: right-handed parallel beta-helix repeat-containing protein [Candidatus Thermoplasmatota archaeon]|nr:right-handed parallel beta-helix repeat-containing protein [Candidatus Thermoplasmatota archaeon]
MRSLLFLITPLLIVPIVLFVDISWADPVQGTEWDAPFPDDLRFSDPGPIDYERMIDVLYLDDGTYFWLHIVTEQVPGYDLNSVILLLEMYSEADELLSSDPITLFETSFDPYDRIVYPAEYGDDGIAFLLELKQNYYGNSGADEFYMVVLDNATSSGPLSAESKYLDIEDFDHFRFRFEEESLPYMAYLVLYGEDMVFVQPYSSEEGFLDPIEFEEGVRQASDILDHGEGIIFIHQEARGTITLRSYYPNGTKFGSVDVPAYPEGIGLDNTFDSWMHEGNIHLMVWRDELRGSYKHLDHLVISIDGEIIDKDLDILPWESPFLLTNHLFGLEGDIFLLGTNSYSLYRFEKDMTPIVRYPIGSHPDDPGLWEIFLLDHFKGEVHLLIRGEDHFGISSYREGELPMFGSFSIEEDTVMDNETYPQDCRLIVGNGSTLVLEGIDLMIEYYDFPLIVTDGGSLEMKGCTNRTGENWNVDNDGRLTMVDCTMRIDITGTGSILLEGNGNVFPTRYYLDWECSSLTLTGIVASGSDIPTHQIFYSIQRNDYTVPMLNIIDCELRDLASNTRKGLEMRADSILVRDCTFENVSCFFNDGDLKIEGSTFQDCDLSGVDPADTVHVIDSTFRDCRNVYWLFGTMHSEIEGSSFMNCSRIIETSSYADNRIEVSKCRFVECENVTEYEGSDLITIEDSLFLNCRRTIGIDADLDEHIGLRIANCTFDGKQRQVYFKGDPLDDVDPFDDPEEPFGYNTPRMVDLAYNTWNASHPEQVASVVSFGIKFLPFNDLEGNLISTEDDDMDRMDDDWEEKNGLDPEHYFDRFLDPDNDGYDNLEEFRAGSDPMDGGDHPYEMTPELKLWILICACSVLVAAALFIAFPLQAFVRGIRPPPKNHKDEKIKEGAH